MDIFQFCEQFPTTDHTIAYLRNRGLLRQISPICGRYGCQRRMTQVKSANFPTDGYQWRCPVHKGTKMSIREGSFFKGAHFSLKKGIMLVYCWSLGIPLHTQKQMLRLSNHTLIDWNNFCRDNCSRWLMENPIRLGGIGRIVQIDESLVARRKAHRGRDVPEQWVFGLFDVTTRVGIIRLVPNRRRVTLLPIIEECVLPGSIIHSDEWAAYMHGAIAAIPVIPPYIHRSVRHEDEFVAADGTHTQNVENFWKNMKMKNKAMSGTTRVLLPTYLDEFMWRQLFGKKTLAAFDNLVDQISHFYQVNA